MKINILSDKNLKLLEELVDCDQIKLKQIMASYLKKHYGKSHVVETVDYVYAEGNIPVALVAHLDTVFEHTYKHEDRELLYDRVKNVLISPQGAGFDDRAGIYAIVQIIRSGLRPHIILTTDEETGCVGASMLVKDHPKAPFAELNYIIELDRRGECDCVFYDCENPDFEQYVEEFGFITNIGSFSDISIICPEWGVAGVNLSIGYKNEHTTSEVLYVQAMLTTINRVINMLKAEDKPFFKYIPSPYSYLSTWSNFNFLDLKKKKTSEYQVQCKCCKETILDLEAIAVKTNQGATVFYCGDCVAKSDSIEWCFNCGEAFETATGAYYCKDCEGKKSK